MKKEITKFEANVPDLKKSENSVVSEMAINDFYKIDWQKAFGMYAGIPYDNPPEYDKYMDDEWKIDVDKFIINERTVRDEENFEKIIKDPENLLFKKQKALFTKYMDHEGNVKIEELMDDMKDGVDRNFDSMIIALKNGKIDEAWLERVRQAAIDAIFIRIEKLDMVKFITIIDYLFPFLFSSVKVQLQLPEILQKKYLQYIPTHLKEKDIERELTSIANQQRFPEDIKNKLIQQAKKYMWERLFYRKRIVTQDRLPIKTHNTMFSKDIYEALENNDKKQLNT